MLRKLVCNQWRLAAGNLCVFRQSVITVRAVSYAKTNIAKYGLLSLPPGSLNHTQEAPLPICHILTRVPPPLSLTGDTYVCGIHLFSNKSCRTASCSQWNGKQSHTVCKSSRSHKRSLNHHYYQKWSCACEHRGELGPDQLTVWPLIREESGKANIWRSRGFFSLPPWEQEPEREETTT